VTQPWWAAFGPTEALLSCGDAEHRLRWADGSLHALDHADAEGELVLAALGGDTSPCLDLAGAWGRHSDDLTVLVVGPRSSADAVTIPAAVLDEIKALGDAAGQVYHGLGWTSASYSARRATAPLPRRSGRPVPPVLVRRAAMRRARMLGGADGGDQARFELIRLLALGLPFQFRLSAAVAHAWSAGGEHASQAQRARPALTAAMAGRLAPTAADWLGIDPDDVDATIHDGAGWGEITRVTTAGSGRLLASLPVAWLSTVWAPGFAVVGSHLVVAVLRADWPHASVLALRAPGQDPVELTIRQDKGHWSVASR
jgi:hypothetical protein